MKKNYQNDEFLRKRKERQKKIRKRRAKITLICLLIVLLIMGAILSVTVFFPIKNILASGSNIYTPEQIVDECGIKTGDNLIIVSEEKALDKLRAKLPFVEKVEIERKLPDTINLKVTDAKEYFCYQIKNNYFTVSEDGWVLKKYKEKPDAITLIKIDKVKCKVGTAIEFTETDMQYLCEEITTTLQKYEFSIEYIDITDKVVITAKVDDRFIVNFGSSKDFESKVRHLITTIKNIPENETGKINLSMWDSQNTQGTFVKDEIK